MDKMAQAAGGVNKNILSMRQAFKAIASVPQTIALGFKGSVRELAAFAGQAKVMGIDLKMFHEAIASALDVESSLEDQFTVEVLTGVHHRQMDAYRYAVDMGEDDKAFKLQMEMYDDYIDKFGSKLKGMSRTAKGAAAKLFGISPEEFTEQVARLGQLQDQFGKNSLKAIQKMQEQNKKAVGDGGAAGFLLGQTKAKEGASLSERFQDDMEKIKTELKDTLMPIVRELHKTYDELKPEVKKIVETLAKSLPGLVETGLEVLKIVKNIAMVLMGLLQPVMQLMEWLGIIKSEQITEIDKNGNKITSNRCQYVRHAKPFCI